MDTRFLTDKDLFVLVTAAGMSEGVEEILSTPECKMQLAAMRGAISQADPKELLEFREPILKAKNMLDALVAKIEGAVNE